MEMDSTLLTNYDQVSMVEINNFPGYLIYSDGRVYSKKSNRFLKTTLNRYGYPRVVLWKNSKGYERKIHMLVAQHFIENPLNLPEINHKDGNKLNADYTNLEWSTRSDNVKHAYNIGLMKPVHPLEYENYRRYANGRK